jgi:hypothetical protein
MAKVMKSDTAVARTVDAGRVQYLVKGIAQCGDRVPSCSTASARQSTSLLAKSGASGTSRDLSNLVWRIGRMPASKSTSACVSLSNSPARKPARYRIRNAVPRTVERSGDVRPGFSSAQACRKRRPSSRLRTRGTNLHRTIRRDRRSGTTTRVIKSQESTHLANQR